VVLSGLKAIWHPPLTVGAVVSLIAEATLGVAVGFAATRASGSVRAFAATVGLSRPTRSDLRWSGAGCGIQLAALIAYGVLAAVINPNFNAKLASNTLLLHGAPVIALIIYGIAAVVIAPVVEEAQFRGLLLRAGMHWHSFALAAVVTSLLFGLLHGYEAHSAAGAAVLVGHTAIFGLVQCLIVRRSGRLTPAVLVHATFNALALILVAT
jgi:membrane protease YdiL (CAAX protease family)